MAIKTQSIDYACNNVQMRGHLAFDDSIAGKRPGVMICHEWWGLNDYIRGRASQVAALGYAVFALDMYGNGKTAASADEAGKLMNALFSNPDAQGRVQAAFDVLKSQSMVDANKIAAMGYCMGGSMALHVARGGMPLRGAACFHGSLKPEQPAKPGSIKAHLLVCHGADDPMVGWDQVTAFKDEMREARADYQIHIYGGAQHAFTNPNADKAGVKGLKYDAIADRRSWSALEKFFQEIFS